MFRLPFLRPARTMYDTGFQFVARPWLPLVLSTIGLGGVSCSDEEELDTSPIVLGVLIDRPKGAETLPELEWAKDNVNDAGGILGRRQLVLEYLDPGDDVVGTAEQFLSDDRVVAVIGPGQSTDMFEVAEAFQEAKKPLVSFTATSGEILRAYGGAPFVWRTKESDIVQTELMLRFAQEQELEKLALLTPLDGVGFTFFNWFGFFATELGFPSSDLSIATWDTEDCEAGVNSALDASPDVLFLVAPTVEASNCAVQAWATWGHENKQKPPRLVLADTGLDVNSLRESGPSANGVEGVSAAPASGNGFEEAFLEREGGSSLPNNAANGYDAVLLLAYGLERSKGEAGSALDTAMREVVGFRGDEVTWDLDGIRSALSLIRLGAEPNIAGATGELAFDPTLYVEPMGTTFAHWSYEKGAPTYQEHYDTSLSTFLTSSSALVSPSALNGLEDSGTYEPSTTREGLQVILASFTSGWENYRHQSDVLRQYQMLKAGGVSDDNIILIGADDLAAADSNPEAGVVRNEVSGEDLYAGPVYDYSGALTADQFLDILKGEPSSEVPIVASVGETKNLYVYIAGHGGPTGIPLNANSTEDGLSSLSSEYLLVPNALREALCEMQSEKHYRRVFLVFESCYSGVFGSVATNGIELGCAATDGTISEPLNGVLLITAANTIEVSYATSYDSKQKAWLADGFSSTFSSQVETVTNAAIGDLYTSVYVGVSGSHVSLYNASNFGKLSSVLTSEFFAP